MMRWICAGVVAAGLFLGCSDDGSNGTGNGGSGGHAGGHGGTGGTGGGGGVGGSAGGLGGAPAAATTFAFDTGTDQFILDMFANPGPYSDGNPQNVGGVPNGATAPTVEFDNSEGKPADGSLKIKVTFNDFNQTITVRRAYTPSATVNLAGKTVTAQIKLDSGTFSGIVHLMALSSPSPPAPTPGYYFGQGASVHLDDHEWHALTFTMNAPEFAATLFAPNDIVQIGVQLASGILAVPPPATGAAGSAGGSGGASGGAGGMGGDGAGGSSGGAGGSTSGGGGSGGASGPAYGSPQAITIHFDTLGWN